MFIGRNKELTQLNHLYNKGGFQMAVIYGRRRIGKTFLIKEFTEDKPTIFFSAQEANDKANLELFSKNLWSFFDIPINTIFPNWNDAFELIAKQAERKRFILVIDEFPYAAEANKSLKSIIQHSIDHQLKNTDTFIILCGSQIGFMESEVLGHKSPLFGRRTAQIKLEAFDYLDAAKMLTERKMRIKSKEDLINFYSCIGGTPHYLSQLDTKKNLADNLADLYFNTSGYLYNEPVMLLKQELREPAFYNSVIAAIATGASRLNEIATKVGEDRSKVIKYLETLIGLEIVHKEFPFGDDPVKSKKGIYRISDNCYNFWYRNIFPNKQAIELDAGQTVLNSLLPTLNKYVGKCFEQVCLQFMIRNNKQLPFVFTNCGRWWGTNEQKKTQEEIDLVFANDQSIIFAECKWRNEQQGLNVLKSLMEKSKLIQGYEHRYYYLFSKSGFSAECKRFASNNHNVRLIELDEILS